MKGVKFMTDMRRVTITVPEEIDRMVLSLRKEDKFARCSYSEIVRQMISAGLKSYENDRINGNQ